MTRLPRRDLPQQPSHRSLPDRGATPEPQENDAAPASPVASAPSEPSPRTPLEVLVPRREHVPDDAAPPAEPAAPRRTLRHRVAATAAAASVGGLVLALALPMTTQAEAEQQVAGAVQQGLFSETSASDMPVSVAEINAVDSEEAVQASYALRPSALVSYPFTSPVLLTDPFGYRTAPVEQFHDAQDFAATEGTPIVAIADGRVLEAGFASDGCGFGVKLAHEIDGQEVTSRYCHMQDASSDYEVGDVVMMGDPVGKVGATGMAFGAHLHLAIRVDDEPVDPMPFLAKYNRASREPGETTVPSGTASPSSDPADATTIDPTAPPSGGIATSDPGSAD
ncbi:M23 family metallopeptidase [Leucobacter allii]|uniref:M23 family metallopeptidase n=1 Tax=Leucobacter allii TaxID=2932247 RepID=A0ABY4FQB6_9MICO|nr:M23 family metallopeptidase [Leucobacter allii]UOQ58471.1 M23 family metallopeptidase [Leucobacter allii]